MKWYVLTLFILVGFVWNASAGQIDSKLSGAWMTTDGPCSPCTLTIQNDRVTFTFVGDRIDVLSATGTREPGIHVFLGGDGELDLALTKGGYLIGFYSNQRSDFRNQSVFFRRKQ